MTTLYRTRGPGITTVIEEAVIRQMPKKELLAALYNSSGFIE
jgi:hypothetical protein